MTLDKLEVGKDAVIESVGGKGALRRHFLDMGLTPGTEVTMMKKAPMGDPIELRLRSYELTLRLADAAQIEISGIHDTDTVRSRQAHLKDIPHPQVGEMGIYHVRKKGNELREGEPLTFGLIGNQNCGKTTLLNIIGGLDQYTSGDLIINGRSTTKYKDSDWDTYRNHTIGFVFQSYNLIPHQSVLSNVELALTLSGVSKAERRKRAVEVLEKVGLGDQIHKKPNQMSGGQMQRVAIARALVNNPDILLADEPTGALDSATSIQIMELLKEISKDRLIIMVTHNMQQATRISDKTAFFLLGELIEYGDTEQLFSMPKQKKTEDYITGRFG